MSSVVFYISGHGFGHAVRQIAVINALRARAPGVSIVVRTAAAAWLFTRTACGAAVFPGETDSGLVQIDSLRPDLPESIRRARAFLDRQDEFVAREAAFITAHGARLVVSDAPPLACAAAAAAGVPSVVCANFTWDWIYQEYREQPGVDEVVERTARAYATAAAGWRLPLHGGFESIAPIVDLPFVARHGRTDREPADIRRALDLPVDRLLMLVSFGGYGLDRLPLDRLDCLRDCELVLTTRGPAAVAVPQRVHAIEETRLYEAGLRYEDLVRAADVVMTKPGYGIIADCVANDTALLYTSRGRFPEYDVMVREMPRHLRCQYLSLEAFDRGEWCEALRALMALPAPPARTATDGAQIAAAMIVETISGL